jgi:methionyl aminopeptidase
MYNIYGEFVQLYNLKGINNVQNISNYIPNENNIINSLNIGSDIHKKVRQYLYSFLKPGISLLDIAKIIESKTIELSKNQNTINQGIGFPASLALNNCAAHFHPEYNDNITFNEDDVLKIDFGVEVNGWITDCAFTVCFNEKYDNLLNAVKEATYTGIKNAGIDVRIGEWGSKIQEVMESYEITLNGKTQQIKTINNLGGHNIINGIIHGGMFLPTVNNNMSENYKFKEGVYAVETFGSTDDNHAFENGSSTLYRLNPYKNILNVEQDVLRFYNKINDRFKTLPFTDRYVQNYDQQYKKYINILKNNNYIHSYPPLCVIPGSYTAQYEHTIYISENNKIVFSNSNDY